MKVTEQILSDIKAMALKQYEEWGHLVIECMSEKELSIELSECKSIKHFVEIQKDVAEMWNEREGGPY